MRPSAALRSDCFWAVAPEELFLIALNAMTGQMRACPNAMPRRAIADWLLFVFVNQKYAQATKKLIAQIQTSVNPDVATC